MIEPAQPPNALLTAALGYVARGFWVFPVHAIDPATGWCDCGEECRNPAKHPRTAHGLLDATNDPARVARFWSVWPTANIGIDCGRSGLAVVDVDVKKGAEGRATMRWVLERNPEAFGAAELVSTPSGGLHYYFAGAIKTGTGTLGAGVDTRSVGGYVLAPPSVTLSQYDPETRLPVRGTQRPYERLLAVAELPALPEGLLAGPGDFTLGALAGEPRVAEGEAARPGVPHGEHRQALLWQAWHLRRVHGLSVDAALPILRAFASSGVLLDANPRDPFTERDLRGMLERIEPQVAAAPPVVPVNPLARMVSAAEADDYDPPVWLVDGFVPLAQLVLIYGDGGVGKTSVVSWLAAHATRRGLRVGVVAIEEPFALFAARVALGGGDRANLFAPDTTALALKFREHEAWIEMCIRENELNVLYFDSIRTHFSTARGENEAISARANLEPLVALAQRTGCAIVGTFHENRAGAFMGSAEMRNVPRVLIEAKRNAADDLVLRAVKCNFGTTQDKLVFRGAPRIHLKRDGSEIHEVVHPLDGSPAFTRPRELFVYDFHERQDGSDFVLADTAVPDKDAEKRARIRELLMKCPDYTKTEIFRYIGGNKKRVFELVEEVKADLTPASFLS